MNFKFNFYGNEVSGYVPDAYDWCLPLLEASLEMHAGVPVCPRFHCGGLAGSDFECVVKRPDGTEYRMHVSDTTSFIKC